MRARPLALMVLFLSPFGCVISDGWTPVRGHVYREERGARVPIEGASVSIQSRSKSVEWQRRVTSGDGRYEGAFWYGGMSLLLLIPLNQTGPDDGVLVFSAPGYRPLSMRIEQKELPGA